MPYFVTNENPDCGGWAVEKENGEVVGCHRTRQEAVDQMVAISLAEDIPVGGERSGMKAYVAPEGARAEAERGLRWRQEYNRGGTAVGVARARDIANGRNLSEETLRRMVSYFARHEVDKQGQGWSPGEEGYPSAGRIAWALWGGDPGRSWAERTVREIERLAENAEKSTGKTTERNTGDMNIKSYPAAIEVKAAPDADAPHGSFTALVSVFNNTDLVGDRVVPGAFEKSLEGYKTAGKTLPVVWNHDFSTAESFIGKTLTAEETEEGLLIKAAFFDTPRAQMVRTLLNERVVTEFSFAYDVIDEQKGEDGVNELRELHILEASVTLKGANPATQLIEAKSAPRSAVKAEPGELNEGTFVTWSSGYGRVEYIMTEGSFGVEGDPLSMEASADNPLALVRIYQENEGEYTPTDMFTAFMFSDLTAADEPETAPEETPDETASVAGMKAGRTLSAKNENAIREAKGLLESVLSSLESPTEPVKAEEPANRVKAEELGMDPGVAVTLLELHELEAEVDHPKP